MNNRQIRMFCNPMEKRGGNYANLRLKYIQSIRFCFFVHTLTLRRVVIQLVMA